MAEEHEPIPDAIQVPLVWEGLEEEPVYAVNQFISQFQDDLFVVSFGLVTPPPLLGTPEQRHEQASRLGFVPISAIARLAFTEERLEHLISVLSENLGNFRNAKKKG